MGLGAQPPETLRVGLICPYSLSVPGGVQGQVLGLARSLRRMGHEVRVLAPVDGPPPDAGITPVGRSIPVSANGSVAPVAPGPQSASRTLAALRDEQFDVVHIHEPLVPGPSLTTLIAKPAPVVGTFHAAGSSAAYRWLSPVLRRSGAPDRSAHRGLRGRPPVRQRGDRRRVHRPVQRDRGRPVRRGRAGPDRRDRSG